MSKHAISFADCEKITRDSFKDECDPNLIVQRFAKTGQMPVNKLPPQYGEAPNKSFFEAACIHAELQSQAEDSLLNPPEAVPEASESTENAEETQGKGSDAIEPENGSESASATEAE